MDHMEPKLRATLRRETRIKLAAVLAIITLGIVTILVVDNLLVSLVLAFVTTYLLTPVVKFLERRGLSKQMSILIPFVGTGALIAFGIYTVLPLLAQQLSLLESQLPRYQVDLLNIVNATEKRFDDFLRYFGADFSNSVNTWIINKTADLSEALPSAVSGSLTVLLLTPFFAFFMLQDGREVSRSVLSLVPNRFFEAALSLHHQLNEQMGGFIRARFLEAAIVGLVVWLGLQLAGFPYATLLSLFAAATNLIPYIGPIIGAVPAVLIALLSGDAILADSMSLTLIVITSIYFFAQLIDIVFIIPLVVARIVNLHPVTVVIVIIVGSQVMGILGMVISIPVASAVKLIFKSVYDQLIEWRT
jgi:putative permease